jgi:hypothetical protein
VFGGLFVLLGNAASDCEAAIVDKYNEVMSLTNHGVVSGETHNMLISALWHARDAIVRACELLSHPTEFTCPKCDQRGPSCRTRRPHVAVPGRERSATSPRVAFTSRRCACSSVVFVARRLRSVARACVTVVDRQSTE